MTKKLEELLNLPENKKTLKKAEKETAVPAENLFRDIEEFDGKIEVRSDRENVFSSHQTIKFPIESANDIGDAYEKFVSMTREDEE